MTSLEAIIRMERRDEISIITLNRPDSLNAFNRALAERFDAALVTVERDDAARVVIVTGAGRAFSAGQDINELAEEEARFGPAALGVQLRERYNPIILRLRAMEKPVIAAINGVATGAGFGIALACDYRIMATSATFGPSPVGLGLIPAVGASMLLPAVVGLGRAAELALLGDRLDAETAKLYGLATMIAPDGEVVDSAFDIATRLTALPASALGLTKRAFNHACLPRLADHLAYEATLQETAASADDHRTRLESLLAKQRAARK